MHCEGCKSKVIKCFRSLEGNYQLFLVGFWLDTSLMFTCVWLDPSLMFTCIYNFVNSLGIEDVVVDYANHRVLVKGKKGRPLEGFREIAEEVQQLCWTYLPKMEAWKQREKRAPKARKCMFLWSCFLHAMTSILVLVLQISAGSGESCGVENVDALWRLRKWYWERLGGNEGVKNRVLTKSLR